MITAERRPIRDLPIECQKLPTVCQEGILKVFAYLEMQTPQGLELRRFLLLNRPRPGLTQRFLQELENNLPTSFSLESPDLRVDLEMLSHEVAIKTGRREAWVEIGALATRIAKDHFRWLPRWSDSDANYCSLDLSCAAKWSVIQDQQGFGKNPFIPLVKLDALSLSKKFGA